MPQAAGYTVDGLVTAFNKVVTAGGIKKVLESLTGSGLGSILKKYNVTPSESNNYPFSKFMGGMKEKLGARKYQTPNQAYNMAIPNVEYDDGMVLERVKFERAAAAAMKNPLSGLNIYQDQIDSFQTRAVDHPIEKAMVLLENGDANTYGVCIDGQNLFDTTHDYGNAAGTQDNTVSGGGETLALVHADVMTAIGKIEGFYWTGSDDAKRLLNPRVTNNISTSVTNEAKGYIGEIHVWPFTDGDDYYVVDVSDDMRPILFQEEKALEFTTPNLQSESYTEEGLLKYGANYRGGFGYGAWWKAVMVTNS